MQNEVEHIGLSQLPRLAGLMDREAGSATYGCADRNFWHYKVIDFSNARFQESALAFALAYVIPSKDNRFYQNPAAKRWAQAAAHYWVRSCQSRGAVDESYPCEQHFCATAFGVWSITQAQIILEEPLAWDLEKAGHFLLRHDSRDVANQTAAAAAALYNLFHFTRQAKYEQGWRRKIDLLSTQQTSEGGFMEYGGFDLGYDTITISLLADMYSKTRWTDLKNMALRCLGHMEGHVRQDGTYSIEGMSRQTQFIYPYGVKYFGSSVYTKLCQGLSNDLVLNPRWMDDRYCVPLTVNYLQAAHVKGDV